MAGAFARRAPFGSQANAWNNAATGVAGTSASFDSYGSRSVTAFGTVNAQTTLTWQFSQDGATWYDASAAGIVVNGNWSFDIQTSARYVRLKSSANVTATATLAAKGGE